MKATTRIRQDLAAIAAIAEELRDLSPAAVSNWRDWSGLGYPGGGNGRSSGMGNPTETAALSVVERRERDRFAREWADHEAAVTRALLELRRARMLARSATNTTTSNLPAGCELCSRVQTDGRPTPWQEVRSRHAPTDRVPDLPRCDWHWRFAQMYGEDASLELARWHLGHKGAKVPPRLIREEHPEAFARVHAKAS